MIEKAFWNCVPESMFWQPVDVRSSSWTGHVPFAFWVVDALRPKSLVELGTWYGMSYLAFCQAIDRLGLDASAMAVDTWQGDHQAGRMAADALASLREAHDPKYSRFSTLMRATFDEALQRVGDGSVDLLHIDGLHTYEAVRHDFETWLPKMSTRGVVLFHDTQEVRDDFGVYKLWAELEARYPHFEFTHEHGLGVLGVGSDLPEAVRELFEASHDPDRANLIRAAFSQLGDALRGRQAEKDLDMLRNRIEKLSSLPVIRTARKLRKRLRAYLPGRDAVAGVG